MQLYVLVCLFVIGLRLLSQMTTDATEASTLGYKMHHIQIYSNSWGPYDYGFLVEGPGLLLKAVLENGVKQVHAFTFHWQSGRLSAANM